MKEELIITPETVEGAPAGATWAYEEWLKEQEEEEK